MLSMAELVQYYGTGRRKVGNRARSICVRAAGNLRLTGVHSKNILSLQHSVPRPNSHCCQLIPLLGSNVLARVSGGGVNGQADA